MRDLVEYVVKQFVTSPDAVLVEESTDGTNIDLLLTVAPEDMGIVIGRSGQTIKSLRKLLTVKAMADGVRVNLQLHDENRPQNEPLAGDDQSLDKTEEAIQNDSGNPNDQVTSETEKPESGDPTSQAPQNDKEETPKE